MRLTGWNEDGIPYIKGLAPFSMLPSEEKKIAACVAELAAYEDTGLTPEDILCIRATQRITPERLAEIVRAEFDGRLVILPCKVGDTVYRIVRHRVNVSGYRMEWEWETIVEAVPFRIGMVDAIGKTVFLTRAEAEAALKGETKDV